MRPYASIVIDETFCPDPYAPEITPEVGKTEVEIGPFIFVIFAESIFVIGILDAFILPEVIFDALIPLVTLVPLIPYKAAPEPVWIRETFVATTTRPY